MAAAFAMTTAIWAQEEPKLVVKPSGRILIDASLGADASGPSGVPRKDGTRHHRRDEGLEERAEEACKTRCCQIVIQGYW